MCRELRKKDVLQEVLRLSHDRSLNKYASIDEEDDFQVIILDVMYCNAAIFIILLFSVTYNKIPFSLIPSFHSYM